MSQRDPTSKGKSGNPEVSPQGGSAALCGDEGAAHLAPLPRAERGALVEPGAWLRAEADRAALLATAAMEVGRLDAVVAEMGAVAVARMALREAEALSWGAGAPVPVEEIARDQMIARASTDLDGLAQARWAVRRLQGQGEPRDLRGFLGLHRTEQRAPQGEGARFGARATGAVLDDTAAAFLGMMGRMASAHPITRGGFARALWPLTELSPDDAPTEGAVWAARVMAEGCEALIFLPLGGQGARGALSAEAHYRAITEAARRTRGELLRVKEWEARALAVTAKIKGDNPARIIAVLAARTLVTAADVEEAAGVSRDTAERLLSRLTGLGLLREVTGTRRFRLWAAAV